MRKHDDHRSRSTHNVACIKKQMSRFLDFQARTARSSPTTPTGCVDLNYVEFLREIGIYFSVNQMLTAECYKQRLERGLTFLEFNYMLMQGYDFLELFQPATAAVWRWAATTSGATCSPART